MKNKKIIVIFVLVILGLLGFYWKNKKKNPKQEQFKTMTVEKGGIKLMVQATGTTLPQNRLELKPPIAGRIESIEVKEGEKVGKGQILAWLSSTERAALLDAARTQGEKELAHWEEVYKPTPLVSPMNGIIIARNMEPGQTVTTQEAPLVMSDRLIVKAQVDETDIGQLCLGQKSVIVLDAYPGERIRGQIDHIAYEAKTVNNVTIYEIDVLPHRVPPFMRSGMTANVTFLVQEKEGILVIPEESVQWMDQKPAVYVPSKTGEKNKQKELKPIVTGLSDGKRVEVTEGLFEGETILIPEIKFTNSENKSQGTNPFMPFGPRGGTRGGSTRNSNAQRK